MCAYHKTGTFCSTRCVSCDRRMKWRTIDARLASRRAAARTMSTRPGR